MAPEDCFDDDAGDGASGVDVPGEAAVNVVGRDGVVGWTAAGGTTRVFCNVNGSCLATSASITMGLLLFGDKCFLISISSN